MRISNEFLQKIRLKLDPLYHKEYGTEREHIQNDIIREFLKKNNFQKKREKIQCREQWLIMTAGPMGSGKSTMINFFLENDFLIIPAPIILDLDFIRDLLPGSDKLAREQSQNYGYKTQIESGTVLELLIQIILRLSDRNMIVDTSMMNLDWQRQYLTSLKEEFPLLKIVLVHVNADKNLIRKRIRERNEFSHRFTPLEVVEKSIELLHDWRAFLSFQSCTDLIVSFRNNDSHQVNPVIQYPWYMTL
jgi:adenylylsulfate kinase-like enzyme